LQSHANLISNNLQSIVEQLSEHREALLSTVTYPLPQFPGKERSNILETLLRTKLEPNVEDWVEEGENIILQQHKGQHRGLSDDDRNALWHWAPGAANAEARKQKWGADYTLQEKEAGIENVVTGLRRELQLPPDEDEAEDEDEEDDFEDSDEDSDEDKDKMEVEPAKLESKPGNAVGTAPVLQSAAQMPLQTIHKFMTTGR